MKIKTFLQNAVNKIFGNATVDDDLFYPYTFFVGDFPTRLDTGVSAVLVKLLEGKSLNCINQSKGGHGSRLKDQIASLRDNYCWDLICSEIKAITTKDGRVHRVKEYWLDPESIDAAREMGADQWRKQVKKVMRERNKRNLYAATMA